MAQLRALSADTVNTIRASRTQRVNQASDAAKKAAEAARAKVAAGIETLLHTALGQEDELAEFQAQAAAVRAESSALRVEPAEAEFMPRAVAMAQRCKALYAAAEQLTKAPNRQRALASAKLMLPMTRQLVAASGFAASAAENDVQPRIVDQTRGAVELTAQLIEAVGAGKQAEIEHALSQLDAQMALLEAHAPGQRIPELDAALQRLAQLLAMLDKDPQGLAGKSRKEVLKALYAACGALSSSIPAMMVAVHMNTGKAGHYAQETGNAVGRVGDTAQAARVPFAAPKPPPMDALAAEYVKNCEAINAAVINGEATAQGVQQLDERTAAVEKAAAATAATLTGDWQRDYVSASKALVIGMRRLAAAEAAGKPGDVNMWATYQKVPHPLSPVFLPFSPLPVRHAQDGGFPSWCRR